MEFDLEERLSRPTEGVVETLSRINGDIIVLGAGGKMGPSLTRMLRRAIRDGRRIIAVSRWSSPKAAAALQQDGIDVVSADLANPDDVARLPEAPNVIFMAGQKFGTTGRPDLTWFMNVAVPAFVARRYAGARVVAFSTGNVYPLVPAGSGGSRETDTPQPIGEYANSCLGRERIWEHATRELGTRAAIVRLNYAVDLRYGVLVDVAGKVWRGEPVDVTMGYANVIWQGDANAQAIQLLAHAAAPAFVANITGVDVVRIRDVATRFGRLLGKPVAITGLERDDALLSNTTRSQSLFGAPGVSTETLIEWVAEWIRTGGALLNKPTHFEERAGRF